MFFLIKPVGSGFSAGERKRVKVERRWARVRGVRDGVVKRREEVVCVRRER